MTSPSYSEERVIEALRRAGSRVRGKTANCPAHDDQHPSLGVKRTERGMLLTCFAGCSRQSVLDSIGLDWSDLFDDAPRVSAEQLMPDTIAGRERPPEWSRFGHVRTVMIVLEQLEEFAFNGPRCRPSQQLLADLTGLSRETVNRCLAKMRSWGWIDWRYERRPGAKWWHCVYTIKLTWTRPLRKKLLKRLDALRGANRKIPSISTKNTVTTTHATWLARWPIRWRSRSRREILRGRCRRRTSKSSASSGTPMPAVISTTC